MSRTLAIAPKIHRGKRAGDAQMEQNTTLHLLSIFMPTYTISLWWDVDVDGNYLSRNAMLGADRRLASACRAVVPPLRDSCGTATP